MNLLAALITKGGVGSGRKPSGGGLTEGESYQSALRARIRAGVKARIAAIRARRSKKG